MGKNVDVVLVADEEHGRLGLGYGIGWIGLAEIDAVFVFSVENREIDDRSHEGAAEPCGHADIAGGAFIGDGLEQRENGDSTTTAQNLFSALSDCSKSAAPIDSPKPYTHFGWDCSSQSTQRWMSLDSRMP